jgi:RNA polymerase sigma-70 factor (ECF subfamily)
MLDKEKLSDRTTDHRVRLSALKNVKTEAELEEQFLLKNRSQGEGTDFWKLWAQYRDYLYQRCLTWMKGNSEDAQEALSRATLKAWEKWLDWAGKITNPRAWLTRLTYNLCMDMHRERSLQARGIESIEKLAVAFHEYVASNVPSPESAVLDRERDMYIHRAVDALPAKLRSPFILRYYQEMSYPDIAQQLALSNDNVRKRVQQARTILQQQLNKYFSGLDDSCAPLKKEKASRWGDFAPSLPKKVGGDSALETLMNAECTSKLINYKVTAICLEVLPHTWYSSPSSMGWR